MRMRMRRRTSSRWTAVGVGAALALASWRGTAAAPTVAKPVWPPPPDLARIEYVGSWSGPRDFPAAISASARRAAASACSRVSVMTERSFPSRRAMRSRWSVITSRADR